jgi:hypothetical protein
MPAPQPQGRVAAPVAVAMTEDSPILSSDMLQLRNYPPPFDPGDESPEGRLLSGIARKAAPQPLGECLASQDQASHQPLPRPPDSSLSHCLLGVLQ